MGHMEQAVSLARRSLGAVSPNPAVGAVVVRDGEVVGEGWTQPPGQNHAEVAALQQAGERAAGATLYTTLEPCSHTGRTPPCVQVIIQAGISMVHAAVIDPNPRVNGEGLSALKEAGIETVVGEGEEEAGELVEAYAKYIMTGVPFVTAKFAMSLDGKIATRAGDSKWISGEEARRYVHELRSTSDAVMVGVNTMVVDDPRLTARDASDNPLGRQPLRILVDSDGRTPAGARLLSEPGHTLVAVAGVNERAQKKLAQAGAEVVSVPASDGSVDVAELLRHLGRREVTSVLVEGGGALLGSMFDLRLVDKVVAFIAPTIIGGKEAPTPVGGVGAALMGETARLERVKVVRFEDDLAVTGYCKV